MPGRLHIGLYFCITLCEILFFQRCYSQIGILGAVSKEIDTIIKSLEEPCVIKISGQSFYTGRLHGNDVVLGLSLPGKVNASATAQLMIHVMGCSTFIFTGVAGAVNTDLHVGDIILARDVVQHDYGRWDPDHFTPWKFPTQTTERLLAIPGDSTLIHRCLRCAQILDLSIDGIHPLIRTGRIASGDQFIAWGEKRKWIWDVFKADVVDMESSAIAQVCYQNGVPFLIIRCVSDLADEQAESDYKRFLEKVAHKSALLVIELIHDLNGVP